MLNQSVPITRSRAVVNESPDVPAFTHQFHLGLEDIMKSNDGINGSLAAGAIGAGLGLLARIARSVE